MIKVIGFDLFGTVFDLINHAASDDIDHYIKTIRSDTWTPFVWKPYWENMSAFSDSASGLHNLRESNYYVVALSNAPLALSMRMSANAGINWDAIIPLETIRTYKPNPVTYEFACELTGVKPEEFLMVSGNAGFGDIENAVKVGCKSQLIRNPGCPCDILDLARFLGKGLIR